jgi:hypothetical protein
MFEIVGANLQVETIAVARGIRELKRLEKAYGKGGWRKRKALLGFVWKMAAFTRRKSTSTKRTASAAKKPKSSASTGRSRRQFVVCLSNRGFAASLDERKIYRALPDAEAQRLGMLRIVDESGEDYLYPAKKFGLLTLPPQIARALS